MTAGTSLLRKFCLSIILWSLLATAASAESHLKLEIALVEHVGSLPQYFIGLSVNKESAATATLTTHLGTYELITYNPRGDWTYPPQFRDDHGSNRSLSQLLEFTSHDWIITFDEGLPTQTRVTIDFGELTAADFSRQPVAVSPAPGAELASAEPVIEWAYDGMTVEEAQTDLIEVFLYDHPSVDLIASGALPLASRSWSPGVALEAGAWKIYVRNRTILRETIDGLRIEGDPWTPTDPRWLVTWCGMGWEFAVSTVGTRDRSWSALKTAYQ